MSTATLTQLAIHGGPKAKTTPYTTGKRYLDNELAYLKDALEQNSLFYANPKAKWVKRACEMMKTYTGMPYAFMVTSGSAAVHLGLIAAGIGPGDEVILSPNTDTGTAMGIIEEGAVPVFADPEFTMQLSVDSIAKRITPRTKAVIVVHLAGEPAPIDKIVEFCHAKGIKVIEDCAQSWGAKLHGKPVGSFADAGCYSTNDYKHISTGDGGFIVVRDETTFRRVANYGDKHYDRLFGGSQYQQHHGVNYRVSELLGAVCVAQLEKVDQITSRQHDIGDRLRGLLKGLPGGRMAPQSEGAYSSYWWSMLLVDVEKMSVGRDELIKAIQAEGVGVDSSQRYDLVQFDLYKKRVVRPWLPEPLNQYPFTQPDGREYHYSIDDLPRQKQIMATGIRININTFYSDQDVDETAAGIWKVFEAYAKA